MTFEACKGFFLEGVICSDRRLPSIIWSNELSVNQLSEKIKFLWILCFILFY